MNIAITGATGFLGRYLVARLAGRTSSDLLAPAHQRSGPFPGADSAQVRSAGSRELWGREAVERLVEGADAVVHAALDHPRGGFRGDEGTGSASSRPTSWGRFA